MTPASIALPAAFAGLVAIGVTVAIERWGGRAGGLIGTLPSTIVPAAAGMAAAGEVAGFREAMFVVPAGMFLNAVFLYLWRIVPPRLPAVGLAPRLMMMLTLSLGAWAILALGTVLFTHWVRDAGLPLLLFGLALQVALVAFGATACLRAPPAPRGHRAVALPVLLARGAMAAGAIGLAVWLSSQGNDLAAGLASVFPAIFVTTMTSLWLSQGEAVQAGAVGPMMLGSGSVAAYALLAAWLLPALGLWAGSTLTWLLASGVVTLPAWFWLRRRARKVDERA